MKRLLARLLAVTLLALLALTLSGPPLDAAPPAQTPPPILLIRPQEIVFLAEPGQDITSYATLQVLGAGQATPWTASINPSVAWLSIAPTQGVAPAQEPASEVTIRMQSSRLGVGTYETWITFTSPGQPFPLAEVLVRLIVPAQIKRLFLPLIQYAD